MKSVNGNYPLHTYSVTEKTNAIRIPLSGSNIPANTKTTNTQPAAITCEADIKNIPPSNFDKFITNCTIVAEGMINGVVDMIKKGPLQSGIEIFDNLEKLNNKNFNALVQSMNSFISNPSFDGAGGVVYNIVNTLTLGVPDMFNGACLVLRYKK